MLRYDCSGCSSDGPIAAADTHEWEKYGLEKRGGGAQGGQEDMVYVI